MPINNRARQYFDYQLRDVPSYDNPYDSYVEKRKKLDEELDKLGVQDDLERDRIAAEYLGRAPSTEAGYGTRFLDALASGGDQFQMNIGAMGEALGDKIGMAPLEIAGRNLAERNRQEMSYAPKFVDTPEEQSQKGFLRNLDDLSLQAVESLVGSSPAMLPPLAGAAIGGPLGVGIGIGGGLLGNAALEGGSTFSDYRNELIQRGYSERDAERLAREARDEVFSENLTDPELLTYGVAQGLVGPMAKGLGVLGTGAIQAGTGGLQEGRQYEVTETATGNPMEQFTGRFSTPEGRNAMAVGMVAEMPMVAAEYGVAKYQQRFDPRVDADATAVIQEAKGRAQQSVNESEAIRKQQISEREQFLKEQRAAENERRKAEKERLKQIQQQRIDEEKLRQEQIKTDKAQLQALKDLSDDGQTDTKLPDDGSADFVEPMTADQIMLQEYEARQQAEQEATQEPTPEPAPPPAPVEPEVVAEPEPTPEPTPEPEPTFSDELDQLDQLEEEQQQQQPEPEPAVEEQVDPTELEAAAAAKEQEIRQRIIDEIKSRAELGDKQPKGLRIGSANRLQNPVRVLQQIAGDEVVETQLSLEQLRLLDQTLSSERRKEVVNEAIKEVLQRQPASSTDISQGVDLREPEIQESTMTPPEPAPAPMEQEQEAAPETPVLPAINDEGKTNNGRVTDDSAGAIPKTVFAPPEVPTLVNRRDQPDLEPDAPLDKNARPSGGSKEGDITNPLKVREKFEEIGYQDQKPVLGDGIDGLIQSRYSQALPNVFVFEGLNSWSAAHFNGGVGIAGRYESDSDKSRIGYLLAHEFGHASHSLLGDKINANSAVKNELKAIEEFLYPGLRQRVQEADTEGQNIDKQFFNYLLSAEELIAEINPYRLANPEQVQQIAPTLSKLLASAEKAPNLVIPRKVFPRGFFLSKAQAIGKLDENLKLKADRQVAGDQLYDQDNSAFEIGRLLKGNLDKDYGWSGDAPFEVLQSAENQIELTTPQGKIELASEYSNFGYSMDRQKLEKASQLLDEAFQADPTKAERAFNKGLKERIDQRLAELNQTETVVEDTALENIPSEVYVSTREPKPSTILATGMQSDLTNGEFDDIHLISVKNYKSPEHGIIKLFELSSGETVPLKKISSKKETEKYGVPSAGWYRMDKSQDSKKPVTGEVITQPMRLTEINLKDLKAVTQELIDYRNNRQVDFLNLGTLLGNQRTTYVEYLSRQKTESTADVSPVVEDTAPLPERLPAETLEPTPADELKSDLLRKKEAATQAYEEMDESLFGTKEEDKLDTAMEKADRAYERGLAKAQKEWDKLSATTGKKGTLAPNQLQNTERRTKKLFEDVGLRRSQADPLIYTQKLIEFGKEEMANTTPGQADVVQGRKREDFDDTYGIDDEADGAGGMYAGYGDSNQYNDDSARDFFGDKISYSSASRPTNAGPSTKLTTRQVKAAMEGVKSVLKKLDPNGDKVTVVANKDEAVAKLREIGRKRDADDLAKRGDNVMDEGFVIPGTGQIFLVADQIEGGNLRGAVDRMVEVTFHEALGHAGLRGLMGEKFDGFIKNFGVKNGKKIDAWLKTEDGSVYSSDPRDVQIEEYIARNFAEKGVQNVGFVEGLAQDVLQSLGMRKYSETALKQAMIKVQNSYVGTEGDIVDGTRGQVEEDEELRNVETVESPLVASFQRWFGDSKVLDKSGNPRVVYHGTGGGEIISFDPSKRGSFTKAASAKKGFFFAGNPKTARLYFDQNKITRNRTNGYYLKMENPLVYDQKGGPRKKLYNDIIKDAIRKGHDGVIIKNTFDGRREAGRGPQDDIFVVFDNKQIKRVDNKGTFNPDDERVKYSRRQASGAEVQGEPSYDENLVAADTSEEAVTAWKDANRGKYLEDPSPELIAAAKEYSEGNYKTEAEMLAAQQKYLAAVKKYDPIKPLKTVPPIRPWSDHANALISSKLKGNKGLLGLTKFIADGVRVGLRLDIPSYKDFGVYTPTVHDKNGSPIGYGKAAKITDVTFGADNIAKKALRVAVDEGSKSPFAKMNGAFVNEDPNVLYDQAVEIMNNPIGEATYRDADGNTWTQVGYKPHRHSWFYDKTDGMPVDTAEEVIQVGALVLAKNAVRGKPTDQKYLTKAFEDGGVLFSRRQRNIFNKPVPNSPSFVLPEDTKVERAIYNLVDKQVDTNRVIDAIEKNVGALKDEFNTRELETLFHGRVTEGTLDFLENKMRPILKGMQEKGIGVEELGYYLHARGAERRNVEMAKRNKKDPKLQKEMFEGGSGMKTTVARKYLSDLSPQKAADFDALAQQVYDITQLTRELLVSEGLETKGTVDAWYRAYGREYVPLMRELSSFEVNAPGSGEGQGMSVSGPASKAATGSTQENVDHSKILANVFSQYERTLVRAEKNKVAKSLYGLAVQNKNPSFWRPIDLKGVKEVGKAINALKALGVNPMYAKNIFAQPTRRRFDFKQRGEVIEEVSPGLKADNILVARINGEDKLLAFNANDDRATRMVSALKNLDTETMGFVANLNRYITRWSTLTNTAYSLPFGITNFTRDVQGAMFNLTNTAIAGEQANVLKETFPALKGIYSQIRNIDGGKNNYSQLWEEFRKAGGKTGYREMYNYGDARQEQIVDELKKMSEGKYNPKKPLRWVGKWVTDYNDALENAVRLAAYKTAIDKGLSVQKAAVLAKNLTVNFNRKGAKAPGIGAYYAFFNAAVQGTARMTEMLQAGRDQQSKNPYKKYLGKRGRQIIQGGLMVGAMQAIMMEMADYPDEEPPYFVRERNIIIPLDWVNNTGIPLDLDQKYINIPMPLGLHVIPNIGRTIMENVLKGELPDAEKVKRLTVSIFDAFNPLGSGGSFLQTIFPTSADPLIAIGQNMDWTGRRIYQEDIDSTKPTPGYTRANEGASALATEIARFINLMSGGTDFKKGILSPTPDQLEYVGGQVTGGVGREIGKLIQTVETGFGTLEELPPYRIPLGGRFYGNVGSSAAVSNQFFTNITRMNEHQAEYEGLMKSGRTREAQRYLQENPEANLYVLSGKYENSVRKLRKQRREMKERDLPRQQIETIENLIRSQMEALNNQIKKYE